MALNVSAFYMFIQTIKLLLPPGFGSFLILISHIQYFAILVKTDQTITVIIRLPPSQPCHLVSKQPEEFFFEKTEHVPA